VTRGATLHHAFPPQIACASPSFCVATASLTTQAIPNTPTVAAVATWAGETWTPFAPVPHPPGHVDLPVDMIFSPACSSPEWCVALGSETDYLTKRSPTLIWTGTSWGYGADHQPPVNVFGIQQQPPIPLGFSCVPDQRWCLAAQGSSAKVLTAPPAP
jgi:hypothetical protein